MAYKKKTNNPKMGRPKINLPKETFEKLCGIRCSKEDIAYILDVDADTLNNWCKRTYFDLNGEGMTFSAVYKKYSARGRVSLRRWQWTSAEKGNVAMQIWLGKNELGQTDKQETIMTEAVIKINVEPAERTDAEY